MAKEMKQNFGRSQSKSASKPDSNMGSGGSSWGMSAIPPLTSAGHSVAIRQQENQHSAVGLDQNNSITSQDGGDENNDSNNSSIQSNSNSEFSDINDSHGHPTICQVSTLRQRSANTPTPNRNYNQVWYDYSIATTMT